MTAIALGQMAERVEAQWRKLSDHIADMKLPCQWFADAGGDYWVAACEGEHGELWCFDDNSSGPVENHMRFCPFCGHPVVVVATPQEPEDDA